MQAARIAINLGTIAGVGASAGFLLREGQETTGTGRVATTIAGGAAATVAGISATAATIRLGSQTPMLAGVGISAAITTGVLGSALLGRALADVV